MSVKPRTIDNLGVEASIQYVDNLKYQDSQLGEVSKFISRKAEIPSVKPYISPETERFFNIGRAASWAIFTPPPEYFIYGDTLFSYMIVPSLGSQEEQEADLEKLQHLEDYLSKKKKGGKKRESKEDQEEEAKQKNALIAMFQCLQKLDKSLSLINARRNQYQRG